MCESCALKIKQPARKVSRLQVEGFAVNVYSQQIATLIHELKENQQHSLATHFAEVMWPALEEFDLDQALLVPMPSKRASFASRGFNPAAEIAKRLSRKFLMNRKKLIPVSNCLRIRKQVSDQASLSGEQRRVNLTGSMSLVGYPAGYKAILIDDVVTTGATLREAKRCLQEAGAEVLGFIAFAETPPQNIRKRHEKVL